MEPTTMRPGTIYRIDYSCPTPGPETEAGTILGYWAGEIDAWGKLTIYPVDAPRATPYYLFEDEFEMIEEVYT